ncbi:MAG: 50S ribosomal protein L1 [Candidatus Saelkia tenebricola]|nr:50S ribosomal protein L1 [Candidatus Saelkia tenebricola]
MTKLNKRNKAVQSMIDREKEYTVSEAVGILKEIPSVKFNETLEVSCKLNVDAKKSDQMVRGSVVLPHGLGKDVRVLVFCKGEKEKEAHDAGADFIGAEDLVEKIKSGWLDFDVVITTPDMMREVGKIGKVLGPRGLMPSPKNGTVTDQISRAVKESKSGKLDFKMDRTGNINVGVGKISFDQEQLVENVRVFLDALMKAKPSAAKGQLIKETFVSTTMGPGLMVSLLEETK